MTPLALVPAQEQRLDAIGRKRLYRVLASNSAVTDAVMGTGVQSMRLPGSAAWMDTRYEDLLAAMVSPAALWLRRICLDSRPLAPTRGRG